MLEQNDHIKNIQALKIVVNLGIFENMIVMLILIYSSIFKQCKYAVMVIGSEGCVFETLTFQLSFC